MAKKALPGGDYSAKGSGMKGATVKRGGNKKGGTGGLPGGTYSRKGGGDKGATVSRGK